MKVDQGKIGLVLLAAICVGVWRSDRRGPDRERPTKLDLSLSRGFDGVTNGVMRVLDSTGGVVRSSGRLPVVVERGDFSLRVDGSVYCNLDGWTYSQGAVTPRGKVIYAGARGVVCQSDSNFWVYADGPRTEKGG